jgi:hypothetical protein
LTTINADVSANELAARPLSRMFLLAIAIAGKAAFRGGPGSFVAAALV